MASAAIRPDPKRFSLTHPPPPDTLRGGGGGRMPQQPLQCVSAAERQPSLSARRPFYAAAVSDGGGALAMACAPSARAARGNPLLQVGGGRFWVCVGTRPSR